MKQWNRIHGGSDGLSCFFHSQIVKFARARSSCAAVFEGKGVKN